MKERLSKRKTLQIPIHFMNEDNEPIFYGMSDNISCSGVFIPYDLHFKEDAKVLLSFTLPHAQNTITVAAHVIRFQKQKRGPGRKKDIKEGIALRFSGLSPEEYHQIEEFIR